MRSVIYRRTGGEAPAGGAAIFLLGSWQLLALSAPHATLCSMIKSMVGNEFFAANSSGEKATDANSENGVVA